jgi:hypothetical protein
MGALIGIAVLQCKADAEVAQARDPVALVNRFLSLLESDEQAAGGMMAREFTIGAGDVGGTATVAELKQLMREIGRDCRLEHLLPGDRLPVEAGSNAELVVGQYHCVTRERPEGHELDIDYLVEGDRIAGMYMHDRHGAR